MPVSPSGVPGRWVDKRPGRGHANRMATRTYEPSANRCKRETPAMADISAGSNVAVASRMKCVLLGQEHTAGATLVQDKTLRRLGAELFRICREAGRLRGNAPAL